MKKYDEENSLHRKYTKTLMIISALFLAVNGYGLSFFPNEISLLLTNGFFYLGFSYTLILR